MPPETLKDQVDAFWQHRQQKAAMREAEQLQNLRAERLRLEAKTQRIQWRQTEEARIDHARRELKADKIRKRKKVLKGAGNLVGGGISSLLGGKPVKQTPKKPRIKRGHSIFNPPNIYSGKPVHKRRR